MYQPKQQHSKAEHTHHTHHTQNAKVKIALQDPPTEKKHMNYEIFGAQWNMWNPQGIPSQGVIWAMIA